METRLKETTTGTLIQARFRKRSEKDRVSTDEFRETPKNDEAAAKDCVTSASLFITQRSLA